MNQWIGKLYIDCARRKLKLKPFTKFEVVGQPCADTNSRHYAKPPVVEYRLNGVPGRWESAKDKELGDLLLQLYTGDKKILADSPRYAKPKDEEVELVIVGKKTPSIHSWHRGA